MNTHAQIKRAVPDAIASLAGIAEEHPLNALRQQRSVAVQQAQRSYEVLLVQPEADSLAQFSLPERYAVAWFTALLHQAPVASQFYRQGLVNVGVSDEVLIAIAALADRALQAKPNGPWGNYPAGLLTAENQQGPSLVVSSEERVALGERLAAALAHTHLLVQHPRDAAPQALQQLLDAGWSTHGIVTLSQLVAFLAFQIRVAHGLNIIAANPR